MLCLCKNTTSFWDLQEKGMNWLTFSTHRLGFPLKAAFSAPLNGQTFHVESAYLLSDEKQVAGGLQQAMFQDLPEKHVLFE